MAISKELMQFRAGSPEEIIERMRVAAAEGRGKQWLNVQPWVDDDVMPKVSILRHLFSSRGFTVPTGTWVPGHAKSTPPNVTQVGLTHSAGHDALQVLADEGVTPPEGWRPVQDHTRRGLVFELPQSETEEGALGFLISAATALAGEIPIDDRWVAGFVTQG